MWWGLFEGLQQGVKRSRRKHVDFIHDIDFIAPLVGRKIYFIAQVAHIIDAGVRSRIDFNQIQKTPLVNRLAMFTLVTWAESQIRFQTIDRFRQQTRRGGLSRTARSGEEIRMSNSISRHRVS